MRFLSLLRWALSALVAALTASAQNWQVDPTFAPVLESPRDVTVRPTALADGGALVTHGGAFIDGRLQGPLVRFKADGTLDAAYTPPAFTAAPIIAYAYPDGRALVVDQDGWRLIRLLANGTLDPAFQASATSSYPSVRAIPAGNDRLYVWGSFSRGVDPPVRLMRLLPDGTRDPGFTAPATFAPTDVALQADGKLVVVGAGQISDGVYRTMMRLNPDGTVDPSFDASATLRSGLSNIDVDVVAALPDGRIHVGNSTRTWRLLTTGSNDPTYPAPFGSSAFSSSLFRATASGIFYYYESVGGDSQLRRLNADGTIDPNFKAPGVSEQNSRKNISSADDRTFFVGSALTTARTTGRQFLTHLLADGSIDPAFASRFSGAAAVASVFSQVDGKYFAYGGFDRVAGEALPNTSALVRLNADGMLDSSFVAPPPAVSGSTTYYLTPIALQPDGRLLVSTIDGVRRLTTSGSFDPTFPVRGSGTSQQYDQNGTIYPTSSSGVTRLLADGTTDPNFAAAAIGSPQVAADGKILYYERTKRTFTRLLPDGTVDAAYAPAAMLELTRGLAWSVLPDGSVLVLGEVYSISTSSSAVTLLRCYRIDPQGNRVFSADVLPNAEIVAAIFHDAVQAVGGGRALLNADTVSTARAVEVRARGEATLLNTSAFRRLRLADPSAPALSLAPVLRHQSRDTRPARGKVSFYVNVWGQHPFSFQWSKDGVPLGAPHVVSGPDDTFSIPNASDNDAGTYRVTVSNALGSVTSDPIKLSFPDLPTVTSPPMSQAIALNIPVSLTINASEEVSFSSILRYSWSQNGVSIRVSTGDGSYALPSFGPAQTGVYRMLVTGAGGTLELAPAILGLATTDKTAGLAHEVGRNIVHANGNVYDQVLLDGASATITADARQVTRLSFVDLSNDIVQLEFSGAGTLSLVLDGSSGPAAPANYNQPDVSYMKGHAIITIVGADETTNLGVFSVGRATATNQSLFRSDVTYDGVADLAVIAIVSPSGKFGGVRAANASFWATRGFTGLYAPGVTFTGPVYLGDIDARTSALPKLILGGSIDVRITGGDLAQTNQRAIDVKGITQLTMTAGTTSHGVAQSAKTNQARLEEDGQDVTTRLVVNPPPAR